MKNQESIPVGCIPSALYRTGGGLPDRDPSQTETPQTETSPDRHPLWRETLLDRDSLDKDSLDKDSLDRDPTGQRLPRQAGSDMMS